MDLRCSRRNALLVIGAACAAVHAAESPPEPWKPISRLAGDWSGTSTGRAGEATVTRRYAWVLNGTFLHEGSTSVYPPQEKNPKGERHEHWGMFSYDKARKTIVLRHFHVEGFVNTFRRVAVTEPPQLLVFESEAFENFSNAWRARESYEFIGEDEFVETFSLAAPGKDFQTYSRSHLKRVSR